MHKTQLHQVRKQVNHHSKWCIQCKVQDFELKYLYRKSFWCHGPSDGTGCQALQDVSQNLFQAGLPISMSLPLKGTWNLYVPEKEIYTDSRDTISPPFLLKGQRIYPTVSLILSTSYKRQKWVPERNQFTIHLTLLTGRTFPPCWGLKFPPGWKVIEPHWGNEATQDWSKYSPLRRTR